MNETGAHKAWPPGRYVLAAFAATLAAAAALSALRPSMANDIADLAGVPPQRAADGSFYATRVHPVLEQHCAGCHGAKVQRARLRLDSFGETREGGKNGPVVKAGKSEQSALYQRLILPQDNPLAMPPKGRPPLRESEIAVVKLWIDAGASPDAAPDQFPNAPPPAPPPIKIPEYDPAAVAKARAPLQAAVDALRVRYPGIIEYAARDSALLRVNAAAAGLRFSDEDFAALAPLAAQIASLDVSGTSVSDRSAPVLASMEALATLRAVDAPIGDAFVNAASALPALQSAHVRADAVSDGARKNLQRRTAEPS